MTSDRHDVPFGNILGVQPGHSDGSKAMVRIFLRSLVSSLMLFMMSPKAFFPIGAFVFRRVINFGALE